MRGVLLLIVVAFDETLHAGDPCSRTAVEELLIHGREMMVRIRFQFAAKQGVG